MNKNFIEIGSEFWLDDTNTPGDSKGQFFPGAIYTSSGRGAISLVLEQLQCKTALLPMYTCDSVICPFQKKGINISWYPVDKQLQCQEGLLTAYREHKPEVVLIQDYFGVPSLADAEKTISKLRASGAVVIWDATHSLLSNLNLHLCANYTVASLRKWLPLPDGGLAFSAEQLGEPILQHGQFFELRYRAQKLKYEYVLLGDKSIKEEYMSLLEAAEQTLNEDVNPYHISSLSWQLLNTYDLVRIREQRKSNYQRLLSRVKQFNYLRPVIGELKDNECPLFFPIYTEDQKALQKYLAARDIFCPIHWPVPREHMGKIDPDTEYIYNNILSLPCDQRYDSGDMNRLSEVLEGFTHGV